jgi:hypothetical protein
MSDLLDNSDSSNPESDAHSAPQELTATPQLIDRLYSAGALNSSGRTAALTAVNGPLTWWPWVEKALLFLGLALTLSGVVCFFAWNWDALPGLAKLAIVQAGIVGCCVVAWQKKIETLPGKAAITAAAVLVGVFLAVFGQVYQTGADAYQLFVGWALLILPWVAMCRFAGLWVLWLAIVNIAVSLFWEQRIDARGIDSEWLLLILGLLNGLATAVREVVTEQGCDWFPIWFRRATIAASLAMFASPAFAIIADFSRTGSAAWVSVAALLIALAIPYWQFRLRKPDLFVLTSGATTITVLACAGVIRLLMEVADEAIVFFGSGLAILSIVAAMTRWLMSVARDIRKQSSETRKNSGVDDDLLNTPSDSTTSSIPLKQLLAKLSDEGLLPEQEIETALTVAAAPEEHAPWFVQALIGFGAWLSCILFLGALAIAGLFDEEAAALGVGVCLLAAGAALDRFTSAAFTRQLGLAGGLTGFGLVGVGAVGLGGGSEFACLTFAFLLATLVFYKAFHSEPFRFLACLSTVGITTCWVLDASVFRGHNEAGMGWGLHALVLLETIGAGAIFTFFRKKDLLPAGYAMTVGLLSTLVATQLPDAPQVWPSAIILALALVWIIRQAWTTDSDRWKEAVVVASVGTGLLAALSAPGILAAVAVTLLGHLERDSVLKRLGILFLPVYIACYYYNLDTTLLLKSLALIGSGLILWAARWHFMRHIQQTELQQPERTTTWTQP